MEQLHIPEREELQWVAIDEPADRNLDVLPEMPGGCPHCGAAFVEIEAVAICADAQLVATPTTNGTVTLQGSVGLLEVRLVCSEGHDSVHSVPSPWTTALWLTGLAAVTLNVLLGSLR